jgi:phage gp36-like protein
MGQQYITRADLELRFSEAEVDAHEAAGADVDQAILDANDEAARYICQRYPAELSSVPLAVVNHVCSLAIYALYRTEPPEWVETKATRAVSFLRAIVRKELDLGLVDDPDTADSDEGQTPDFLVELPASEGSTPFL